MPGRKTTRVRAIVLGKTKLAEQDLILTTLSATGEQVRVVAKGARKPGSRLAARTELFLDVDMLISHGRGLGIVAEAQVVEAHRGLMGDVERTAAASALCEVARLTSFEGVEDPYLFAILNRALSAIEFAADRAHMDLMVAAYALKVLSHCGWMPVLDGCVACGETPAARFSVAAGGLLCESCAREVPGAEPVSEGHVGWLRAVLGLTFDALAQVPIDDGTAAWLVGEALGWGSHHLDARLKALEFYVSF